MSSTQDMVIESERLRLVAVSEAYAEAIFTEFTAEITEFMGPRPPNALADTLAYIRETRMKMDAGELFEGAILSKESGEFLGHGGLHGLASDAPELGIWIKKSAHGEGYGLEAIAALVDWAFEKLKVAYVKYPVDRRNMPSRRIPEALGGLIEAEYSWTNESGRVLELLEYRIYPAGVRFAGPSYPSP